MPSILSTLNLQCKLNPLYKKLRTNEAEQAYPCLKLKKLGL